MGLLDGHNVALIGQIGGAVDAVAVVGANAYVGAGPWLIVLDISNPAQPLKVGETDVMPGVVKDVAVDGTYAYVADSEAGLRVVNIANPAAPVEVGFYDTPGYAESVAISGTHAYVADYDAGLRVVSIANPAAPAETGPTTRQDWPMAWLWPGLTPTWRMARPDCGW